MFKKTAMAICALSLSFNAHALTLPNFPVGFKSGSGAIVDGVIYAGLGSAGTSWYKIDTNDKDPRWEKMAPFPAMPLDQSQAVALNDQILIFGGAGRADDKATRISVSNKVFSYDIKQDKWSQIETVSPIGLTGHSAIKADESRAVITGSVNKQIFDSFFYYLEKYSGNDSALKKLNDDYISKPCEDYFFNEYILCYDAAKNLWHNLGIMPAGGRAGSAIASKDGVITVINGERKPGLRSASAFSFTIDNSKASFKMIDDLCPPEDQSVQEGVAGAFAGYIGDTLIVAGGANFPGSSKAYAEGQLFAHKGLDKTWRDEIYTYRNGRWSHAGNLPLPLGYSLALEHNNEILIIGGESDRGEATSDVLTISIKNGRINVE